MPDGADYLPDTHGPYAKRAAGVEDIMVHPRVTTVVIIAALAAMVLSCGGGTSVLRGTAINKDKPAVLTRAAELAKMDALPKPERLSEGQWIELKNAMAAAIPEKAVCVPPGPDEAITDFAFVRDEQGVGSLTWSFYLPNDYNLDGIVNVSDITALANHFGEAVGNSPTNWIIDTSGNGIIDIPDITGIAVRYGLSLLNFSLRQYVTDTQNYEMVLIPRGQAVYDETGVMHFTYPYDTSEWLELAVAPMDNLGDLGSPSNKVLFHPARILSLTTPSGKVGDAVTFTAEVEGAEPLEYSWVLSNGCNPKRSTDPSVEATLVAQGTYNGKLTVSNLYGTAEWQFNLLISVPPTISSVSSAGRFTNEKIALSSIVTGTPMLEFYWSFGSDSFPSVSRELAPEVIFSTDGEHNCTLTVSNDWGSANYPFTVTTGTAPQVFRVTPLSGGVGDQVVFNAEVFGTQPIGYSWNFMQMCTPATSYELTTIVVLETPGDHLCKLVATNDYGETTYWFNFHVGIPPSISDVMGTSTKANYVSWFFARYDGDEPISWTWTFDMWEPDPPLVFYGIPVGVMLPPVLGTFDCSVTAQNPYGSVTFPFTAEVTELPPPPPF